MTAAFTPGVRGVFHFSFTVSDLDRSIRFYRDDIQLRFVHEQLQDNNYTRRFVGIPGARLRIAQFAIPGQSREHSSHDLELVEYLNPRGRRSDPAMSNPGAAHLAFKVHDIAAVHSRLVDRGVRFVSEPIRIEAGANEGGWTCYFRDPDDITLEILQPPVSN